MNFCPFKQFKKTFDHENNSWGFPKFHLWDDLITEEKVNQLIQFDIFVIFQLPGIHKERQDYN